MNYWKLVTYDNEEIQVKPENAELIQRKLDSGEGYIRTPTRSINIKTIKDFVETSEIYTDQKLIESAAKAFNEPQMKDESVVTKWVKKSITKREYARYYSASPGYRKIGSNDSYITVAFRLPIHQIDYNHVQELGADDERNMSISVS